MLVVTGTGRSGTSMVAKWFKEMGLLEYEGNWLDRLDAGLEPMDVSKINGALWIGNDPDYPTKESCKEAIAKIDYPVIKDPKFLYGDVLETWLEVRHDLRFLVLLRDYEAVYKSRMSKGMVAQAFKPDEMAAIVGKFISQLHIKSVPHETMMFPNFLDSYEDFDDKLCYLGFQKHDYKKGLSTWNRIVDKSKIHF